MLEHRSANVPFDDRAFPARIIEHLRAFVLGMGFDAVEIVFVSPDERLAGLGKDDGRADASMRGVDRRPRCSDPIRQAALTRLAPFLWDDVAKGAAEPALANHDRDTKRRGVAPPGGTVPIHGADGGVTLIHVSAHVPTERFRRHFQQVAEEIWYAGLMAHKALAGSPWRNAPPAKLSPRQRSVLYWVVQGKTNWEIGEILGINADTVRQHVMKLAKLLHVTNRVQVAVAGVTCGIVSPGEQPAAIAEPAE